ncbi:hypothetical protein [Flavobacterium sp. IB48]|uniref:hypothetical protein n=1 Tax=Flavobacterium sp. IB48 TaxID=2779375 RepID=UPI0018E8AD3C|nr:hypothetical protein [Flavobacterium sp. IB48]MBJ2126587.1 hypothetical protein [Flavobacterium sp. IB48]
MKKVYYSISILLLVLLVECSKVSGEKLLTTKTIEIPDNLKERFKDGTETTISDTLAIGDSYVQVKVKTIEKSGFKFITETQIYQVKSTGFEITGNLGYRTNKEGDKQLISGQVIFYKEKLGSKESKMRYFTITSNGKIVKT